MQTDVNSENNQQNSGVQGVFDEHDKETNKNAPGETPLEKALKDFKFSAIKSQIATFRFPVDGGVAELVFSINGLDDEALKQVDALIVAKQRMEADSFILENDDLAAMQWFFDNCVVLQSGFDGELPHNWRDEFDASDKQNVSRQFLSAVALSNGAPEVVKKLVFGSKKTGKKVTVRAGYNNEEVDLIHELPANYNSFLPEFKAITGINEIKRGEDAMNSPDSWGELGELYDRMNVVSDDYDENVVPLNHKNAVMRDAFTSNMQKQVKKQKV